MKNTAKWIVASTLTLSIIAGCQSSAPNAPPSSEETAGTVAVPPPPPPPPVSRPVTTSPGEGVRPVERRMSRPDADITTEPSAPAPPPPSTRSETSATTKAIKKREGSVVVEPPAKPQAGLLTAGDYDDVLNPNLYNVYLDRFLEGSRMRQALPYVDANNRIALKVINDAGTPLPFADIALSTENGTPMFPLTTGANGVTYIYPNYDAISDTTKINVSVEGSSPIEVSLSDHKIGTASEIIFKFPVRNEKPKKLDLLLTIDATGSMSDEMAYL